MLRHHFRIGSTLTVVDAVTGLRTLEAHPESLRQAAVADQLVISKIDLVSQDQISHLRGRLAALNPAAAIVESDEKTEVDTLLAGRSFDRPPPHERASETRHAPEPSHEHARGADAASHHGGIRATMLAADEPLNWTYFALWLSMLLNRHGQKVLRLKGLANIVGSETPVVIQGVQHLIHKPEHLERWPDRDRVTRLVVIADDVDPEVLRRSFAAYMGVNSGARAGRAA
jgi:G3E family GTPase